MKRRFTVALISSLILIIFASAPSYSSSVPTSPQVVRVAASAALDLPIANVSDCKQYVFVGLKGSGESNFGSAEQTTLGNRLRLLYDALKLDQKFQNKIAYSSLGSYKAIPVALTSDYFDQVALIASSHLSSDFSRLSRLCPSSRFIFAGYSQGAYLVQQFLQPYDVPYSSGNLVRQSILGAVLLANPGQQNSGILPVLKHIDVTDPGIFLLSDTFFTFATANQLALAAGNAQPNYGSLMISSRWFWELFGSLQSQVTKVIPPSLADPIFWQNLSNVLIDAKIYSIAKPLSAIPTVQSLYYPNDLVADTETLVGTRIQNFYSACIIEGWNIAAPNILQLQCIKAAYKLYTLIHKSGPAAKKVHDGYTANGTNEKWVKESVSFLDGLAS